MKLSYFAETDTLKIEFRSGDVVDARDLDENTLLDVDASSNVLALTVEHVSERTGLPGFPCEQVFAHKNDALSGRRRT